MSDPKYTQPRATLVGMPHRDRPADMTLKNLRDKNKRSKAQLKELLEKFDKDRAEYLRKNPPKKPYAEESEI